MDFHFKRAGRVINTKCRFVRFARICSSTLCSAASAVWGVSISPAAPQEDVSFLKDLSVFLIHSPREEPLLESGFYCYLYLNKCRADILGIRVSFGCVNLKISFSKNEKFAKLPHLKPLLSTPSLT